MGPVEVFNRLQLYLRFIGLGGGSLYKGRVLHLKGRFFDEKVRSPIIRRPGRGPAMCEPVKRNACSKKSTNSSREKGART